MLTLRYDIYHIDGRENRLADLGTRWGNRFARTRMEDGLGGGIAPLRLLRTFVKPVSRSCSRATCRHVSGPIPTTYCRPVDDDPAAKRAFWTPEPATNKQVVRPDRDVDSKKMLPVDLLSMNRGVLVSAQKHWAKSRPKDLKRGKGPRGLWKNKAGAVWVPDEAKREQHLLYAVAHQGASGHRGREATLKALTDAVFWSSMNADVRDWHGHCLQCIKLSDGNMIPRPLGETLVAERPGEVLMLDYIDMGEESDGMRYCLMCADKFGRLLELDPAASPTGVKATQAVLQWSSRFGLPDWIITDGGSHFKNKAMKHLTDLMGLQHHITLVHCPWANGAIEIFGRQLLWTTRALLSELGYPATEWMRVRPLINFVMNHKEREVLGGRTPIEVMTDVAPRTPLHIVMWNGVTLKDADGCDVEYKRVEKYMDKLAAALDKLHQNVKKKTDVARLRKAAKAANARRGLQLEIGDLTMVAAWGNSAHIKRGSKLCPTWQGPYQVVGTVSPTSYQVVLLGREDKPPKTIHWSRMKRFGGPNLDISERLVRTAVNDCQKFEVKQFTDWRENDDGDIELRVRWEGFEPQDDTWQGLEGLFEDVPVLVRQYLRSQAGKSEELDAAAAKLD